MATLHEKTFTNYSIAFSKADGTPGIVDGSPVWALAPAELGTVEVSPDGLSAKVTWAGAGDAILSVTADGDLGEGVFPISASDSITFVAPLGAVSATLTNDGEQPVV